MIVQQILLVSILRNVRRAVWSRHTDVGVINDFKRKEATYSGGAFHQSEFG